MVDWDRVEQLRDKGWDWDRIAADDKVGFHPETSVRDPGRALRGLYHRQKSRESRSGGRDSAPAKSTPKQQDQLREKRWSLVRIGYLIFPAFALWGLLAYVAPSPVGVLVPFFPWVALGLAASAFILIVALWRTQEKRWGPTYRTAVVAGVVIGLAISGGLGVTSYIVGCPYLPPASTLAGTPGPGWTQASVSAWQESGKPVLYFYGASWCPYCSAGSWTMYKALTEFGSVTGANSALGFSSTSDVYAGTPEIILGDVGYSSSTISFVVNEDLSGVDGTFPAASGCIEQAYVTAYSGSAIPFVVINGQYVHASAPIINPGDLQSWSYSATGGTGAQTVYNQVNAENGSAWNVINTQAYWIMAFLTKATGESVSTLAAQYRWSSATQTAVSNDLSQLG
jgi:thiol-disulfide isomerase/thioredoxin